MGSYGHVLVNITWFMMGKTMCFLASEPMKVMFSIGQWKCTVSFGYLIVTNNNAMWGRAMWASRLGKRQVGVHNFNIHFDNVWFMIFIFWTIVLISGVCRLLGGPTLYTDGLQFRAGYFTGIVQFINGVVSIFLTGKGITTRHSDLFHAGNGIKKTDMLMEMCG